MSHLWRVEHQVVDPSRSGVDEAILDAVDDRLEGHVQVDHDVDRRLALHLDKRGGDRIKPNDMGHMAEADINKPSIHCYVKR